MNSKQPIFDRPPPFDLEAEINVLGSVMLWPAALDRIGSMLQADDFHDPGHQLLYRHLEEMHAAGRRVDPSLVIDKLKAAGHYEQLGGAAYLGKILHAVPNAAHAVYYAEIVHEKASLRRLIETNTEILRRAYDGRESSADLIEEAERTFSALGSRGHIDDSCSIEEVARATVAEIQQSAAAEVKPGIMSGLPRLDIATGPMLAGELIVVAARPGCGKSALAMQVAIHAGGRERQTLFVSLEMENRELVRRELCKLAGLDSRDVRAGAVSPLQLQALRDATFELEGLPIQLWSPPQATMSQIRAAAKRRKATRGLDLVVVDYLGLIKATAEERRSPRYELIGEFTATLKRLAKELEIPIVLLCQLNREADGAEPRLSHLRESGAIEQDADTVLFVHHPDERIDRTPNKGTEREAFIIVAKHRHGEVGKVKVTWVPQQTMFYAPSEDF